MLDVRDTAALRDVVERTVADLGRIDVVISNAGYGVFGAAEELTDEQVEAILATNLTASIQLIRAVLPHMRASPRRPHHPAVQLRRPGRLPGQLAVSRHQVRHRGLLRIGRPGGRPVRHRRHDRRARRRPHRIPLRQCPSRRPAARLRGQPRPLIREDARPGQRTGRPATRPAWPPPSSTASTRQPAPLRMVLGSQALESTVSTLRKRIADFEAQKELAASTDYPSGE